MGQLPAALTIRFETASPAIHPSVMFFNRSFLDNILNNNWLQFNVVKIPDLIGRKWFSPMQCHTTNFYPLIRTNKWNPHPIYAGIYGNCFYHHGCGSRPVIGASDYYDLNLDDNKLILGKITKQFNANRIEFIKKLSNPNHIKLI
jgi:hypothetical protein